MFEEFHDMLGDMEVEMEVLLAALGDLELGYTIDEVSDIHNLDSRSKYAVECAYELEKWRGGGEAANVVI